MQVSDIEYQLQQMDDDGYGCAVTSTPAERLAAQAERWRHMAPFQIHSPRASLTAEQRAELARGFTGVR